MCPSLRTAAAAVVLVLAASDAHAQYWYPPGYKPRTVVVNIPYGPFGTLSLPATVFQRTPLPPGVVAPWYYAPFYPVPVPVPSPQQPPIIINNNPPAVAAEVVPGGGKAGFPNEFDPPKPAGKNPPKNGRAAGKPAAKAAVGAAIPVVPKQAPKLAGVAEADRVAEAGKKAFADGQYGRALELLRKAVALTPQDPSAHFNAAQAAFALGKYRDAVEAIAAGVALRPDWADARFAARDLYGKKPTAFDDHLKALREAVAAFPDDPTLLFLLGHQFWFDGKAAEARPLFQRALALGRDRTPAGAFR
ncbi:MAG TPA: tetratricopeptide repeat protein [Gemmataceae bacterium]|jgi:hypothetical protein|nr:tetratricopeptide repeat protein [Gemmataceae bacterium]